MTAKYFNDDRQIVGTTIFCLIALGLVLRSTGYFLDPVSLWLDEAMWLDRLLNSSVWDHMKRPIGYKVINKALFSFGLSEPIIRFSSWLPSVFVLILIPLAARRLFKAKSTIVLAVIFVSTNSYIICLAKEFKPYSLELFCHVLLLLGCLIHLKKPSTKSLMYLWLLAFCLLFFAYNLVFILPGIYLISLYTAHEGKSRGLGFFIGACGLFVLTATGMVYFSYLDDVNMGKKMIHWGSKYDVFYLPVSEHYSLNHFKWMVVKYKDLVLASAAGKSLLDSFVEPVIIAQMRDFLLISLHCMGLAFLIWKRDLQNTVLLVLPLFVIIFVHLFGWWLFGPFRTNLFILLYFLFIILYGYDAVITRIKGDKRLIAVGIALFFVFFQFSMNLQFYSFKNYWARHTNIRDALEYILKMEKSKKVKKDEIIVFGDIHSVRPIKYYLSYSRSFIEKHKESVEKFEIKYLGKNEPEIFATLNSFQGHNVWIMLNKKVFIENKSIFNYLKDNAEILYYYQYPQSTLIVNCSLTATSSEIKNRQSKFDY